MLKKLNHMYIVLIPNVACPKKMARFRPILLCIVSYKIIAKILMNRLKGVMPKIISGNQSSFISNRLI